MARRGGLQPAPLQVGCPSDYANVGYFLSSRLPCTAPCAFYWGVQQQLLTRGVGTESRCPAGWLGGRGEGALKISDLIVTEMSSARAYTRCSRGHVAYNVALWLQFDPVKRVRPCEDGVNASQPRFAGIVVTVGQACRQESAISEPWSGPQTHAFAPPRAPPQCPTPSL